MIHVEYRPGRYQLKVTGHAMSDEIGKDLVCAGASALVQTLGENVRNLKAQGAVRIICVNIQSGDAEISCVPVSKYKPVTRLVFDTIVSGLEMISRRNPEYLEIEIYM